MMQRPATRADPLIFDAVQGYLHAYRSVTGVDLSVDITNARIDATMPSAHLVKRLAEQRQRA
jgi:hypothetical protein